MRVAVISINIGDYSIFWEGFYDSAERNFIPEVKKDYYVFSDKGGFIGTQEGNVEVIHQADMGWPSNTMRRFELFCGIKGKMKGYDYIFFANANTEFVYPLRMDFIDCQKRLIAVEHPGYHFAGRDGKPFENRIGSRAYVGVEDRRVYVQGAFYGGKADAFIEMANELAAAVNEDIGNGIVAVWHDESFLNAYVAGRGDVQILPWQYLYYEEYALPYDPVILLRNKRRYITNKNGRYAGQNYFVEDFMVALRNIKWRALMGLGIYKHVSIFDEDGRYVRFNQSGGGADA